jgi:hypothetical protein
MVTRNGWKPARDIKHWERIPPNIFVLWKGILGKGIPKKKWYWKGYKMLISGVLFDTVRLGEYFEYKPCRRWISHRIKTSYVTGGIPQKAVVTIQVHTHFLSGSTISNNNVRNRWTKENTDLKGIRISDRVHIMATTYLYLIHKGSKTQLEERHHMTRRRRETLPQRA